jgi:hypothetical protein|tara:strand:+ start:157 stop:519 length:363 start_codon:yes stop_codon:yes gene_type:complete
MGYRSKVIIGVKSGELSKQFDEILKKHENIVGSPNGDYLKVIDDPNEMKRYQFEHIKWYEMEDWCKEIMDYLEGSGDGSGDGLGEDAFCVGLGYDDGHIHSEIGDWWDYVEQISEINLID